MPNYRRAWHAGGTYFFTVNLLQRHGNDLLTRLVDLLREVVRSVRSERGIWQRRYWEHLIRDDMDMQAHMDYAHFNPVKFRRVGSLLPTRSTHMRRNALRLLRPTAAIKTAADNPRGQQVAHPTWLDLALPGAGDLTRISTRESAWCIFLLTRLTASSCVSH